MAAVLSIDDLSVSYGDAGLHGARMPGSSIHAVRQVSLDVARGECVGIVGESGSGKTQVVMAAMGLLNGGAVQAGAVQAGALRAGAARVGGRIRFEDHDILAAPPEVLNAVRGSKLTMIFQDPMTSLTPHLTIGKQLAEVLVEHARSSWREAQSAALAALTRVRVPEPARRMRQYPHELSGGLRQRVMIAMSLLCSPSLLIADEPTTALDVTVQSQIIELLRALRLEYGMAIVLISHDFAVVAGLADRILVMYAGRIVESAPAVQLLQGAAHPYSAELLRCVPNLHAPRLARMPSLPGQPPSPTAQERGCAFAPRCPRAAERCVAERPLLRATGAQSQLAACHFPLTA